MQTDTSWQKFQVEAARAGLRMTATRRGIFEVLLATERPLHITEIVKGLPNVHYVSVYRSIDALLRCGLIKQVPFGFKNRFELSDALLPHHHHATCDKCGKMYEINNQKIEAIARQLASEVGMTPTTHHFEVYGICVNCNH
jgi:Fe2+ or Zn2+ uptake regulation protein